jgi:hypothetical protein
MEESMDFKAGDLVKLKCVPALLEKAEKPSAGSCYVTRA